MIREGQPLPQFRATTSDGETITNDDLLGQPTVLFFYPKSFTHGCTIETRQFARVYPDLEAQGVRVLGVSTDDVDTQCRFAEEMGADFPLLADPDGEVAKAFGVKRFFPNIAKRVTFFIDEAGRVEAIWKMELKFEEHVERVLEHLSGRTPVKPGEGD